MRACCTFYGLVFRFPEPILYFRASYEVTKMLKTTEIELIESAQRGDTDALQRLIVQARPDLTRYAARHCATSSDAEEAVQESLVIVFRQLPSLRVLGAYSSWLFQIIKRECQRLSQKMFHQDVPLDAVAEKEYLHSRTDIELRLDIAAAIQSLPDIYREVIVLRDFEELTVKEIASRLHTLPETVKTRIHRGRQMIREHLLA